MLVCIVFLKPCANFFSGWLTGKKAVLSPEGDPAPYNGEPEYSINTDAAEGLGFTFSDLRDRIFGLLDRYIEEINKAGG